VQEVGVTYPDDVTRTACRLVGYYPAVFTDKLLLRVSVGWLMALLKAYLSVDTY